MYIIENSTIFASHNNYEFHQNKGIRIAKIGQPRICNYFITLEKYY